MSRKIALLGGTRNSRDLILLKEVDALGFVFAKNHVNIISCGIDAGILGRLLNVFASHGGVSEAIVLNKKSEISNVHSMSTSVRVVNSIEYRKLGFLVADAFVVLPGGIGTLDEIVFLLMNIKENKKKCKLNFLSINGFYKKTYEMLCFLVEQGYMDASYLNLMELCDDGESLASVLHLNLTV